MLPRLRLPLGTGLAGMLILRFYIEVPMMSHDRCLALVCLVGILTLFQWFFLLLMVDFVCVCECGKMLPFH